jgi:putative transcription factor
LDNKKVAQLLGGDEDNVKVAVMSHDLKIAIQQGRQEKNWTQEQLAHAINEIKTNVRDYENGKMVPSGTSIVKMEKALGCKLPRPIKKKIGE